MALDQVGERVERPVAALIPKGEEDASLIYQQLQFGEIRVVKLAPGEEKQPIRCTLDVVSLDDIPSYETLSYTWGDPSLPKKTILLQEQLFEVTPSLESALRHLRSPDSERTIWVDAVCINQKDLEERSLQVRQMQFIYARSWHLVIWVGEADEEEDSDLGMETFEKLGEELKEGSHWDVDLANVSLIKNLPQETESFDPKPWVTVNRLLRRDWFERVWVIQEICAPDAQMSFVCGYKSVPWDYVSRVSHAIQRYRWSPAQVLALIQAKYDHPDYPVNIVREMWKSQAAVAEAECTLLKQLWHFKDRLCGDPRDKVFAILGICKDVKSGDVNIDYSASVARVYSEVSNFIIMRDHSLKLLSACQSYGSRITELPSWAPDWSIDSRYRPTRPITSWVAGDESDMFNTSASFLARVEISDDIQTMSAQGLLVGKISILGTHLENDADTKETLATQVRMFTLFKDWWPCAQVNTAESSVTSRGEEPRATAFWRTICTDIDSFSRKAILNERKAKFPSRIVA